MKPYRDAAVLSFRDVVARGKKRTRGLKTARVLPFESSTDDDERVGERAFV